MKLLSLNIWGGTRDKILFDYLRRQARHTDIFCFQEVFDSHLNKVLADGTHSSLFIILQKLLSEFQPFYLASARNVVLSGPTKQRVSEGLAIFVRHQYKSTAKISQSLIGKITDRVEFKLGKENSVLQGVEVQVVNQTLTILNFHGVSRPGDKLDTPKRLRQSRGITKVLRQVSSPKILCGDFNLLPQTESIKMIERQGMKNLIKDFKIKNTRNTLSWKKYGNRQYYADFTFVSKEIKVKNFKVPYVLASDHLPMILEFN